MCRQKVYLLCFLITAVLSSLLITSCTNDLKKIQEIAAKQTKGGADTTRGMDVIFSDSGRVQGQMTAPLMLDYSIANQNTESYKLMPKGIKVIKFDKFHKEDLNIIADTAYYYDIKRLVKFYKNVVMTSATGDVFKTEELIWDMTTRRIYSTKEVDLKSADGTTGHAASIETNEGLYPLITPKATGVFMITPKSQQ